MAMPDSFFFYDLETSGVNPRTDRIMQFAGQRTNLNLEPVGEPFNFLIKLSEDVLPEPDAILVTGITPQKTISEGITEAEFFKLFCEEIVKPGTVFAGFNNIRFDDEFIRFGLYRNFYDAYEWQWKNNCSRWDILDLTRITRALRPDGIKWPFAPDGKPSNRLELLSSVNGLDHENAHDALNDVLATIAIARVVKQKQPKLFDYEFSIRNKKDVEKLVKNSLPFIYVSGKYSSEYEKLAIVYSIGAHPKKTGSFVYDLRFDPTKYLSLPPEKLAGLWRWTKDENAERLPVKTLHYNKCPAVAPLGVLRKEDAVRLKINEELVQKHLKILKENPEFYDNLCKASNILEDEYSQTALLQDEQNVDGELYKEFISDEDKNLFPKIRSEEPAKISGYASLLNDSRLKGLLPLYKARNYPKSLSGEERAAWESFRPKKLQKSLPKFMKRIQELSAQAGITSNQQYLLEELHLYAESVMPAEIG